MIGVFAEQAVRLGHNLLTDLRNESTRFVRAKPSDQESEIQFFEYRGL